MILRDMYCERCGRVEADVDCSDTTAELQCVLCRTTTVHRAVCNGGLRSRYRFADWPSDPEYWRGQSKVVGAEAVTSEGETIRRYTSGTREIGAPMTDDPRYHNGTDERETRRDIIKHATRRTRGTNPVVLDLGKQNG